MLHRFPHLSNGVNDNSTPTHRVMRDWNGITERATYTWHPAGIPHAVSTPEPTVTIQFTAWPAVGVPGQGLAGLKAWPGPSPPRQTSERLRTPSLAPPCKPSESAPPSCHPSLYLQIFKQHKRRINLRRESGRSFWSTCKAGRGAPGLPGLLCLLPPHTCHLPTSSPARFQTNLLLLPASSHCAGLMLPKRKGNNRAQCSGLSEGLWKL